MHLYLLRHGDAIDRRAGNVARDEDRPLTEDGQKEARRAGRALAALGVSVDLLLTSPLVRARQTAELAGDELSPPRAARESEALAPGGDPEATLAAIDEALFGAGMGAPENVPAVLLVGHMPDLGELAGWLVWGRADATVWLRTGGLCRVDLPARPDAGAGELRWLLPPGLLRRLS